MGTTEGTAEPLGKVKFDDKNACKASKDANPGAKIDNDNGVRVPGNGNGGKPSLVSNLLA